ncbi:K, P-type ATPase [Kockovaella imperatae]|uniref:K, P-type ATPase n=1 Tax=Kockovaella imperatae TaxID=4999 RepID=A0A1Y1U9Z3_9TREE|nr:K, P-type ATPase [Kockovaella imperatae]ORX34849.1 K, P-type ATPase [Kockovaella imperatae]
MSSGYVEEDLEKANDLEKVTSGGSTAVGPSTGKEFLRTRTINYELPPQSSTRNNRIPIEYRTLSIHVYDSQRFEQHKEAKENPSDAEFFAKLDYHTLPADEVCQRLNVSRTLGLDKAAAAKRLQRNGPNRLSKGNPQYWKKILRYLFGDFCSVLWIGVIIFFISWKPLGDPPAPYNLALGILVIIVILLQAFFSAFQDWSSQKVMNSILNLVPENATVTRDGQQISVPSADLVTGDIVHMSMGNRVPADIRILQASPDLKFDRSILTGEAEEVAGVVDTDETNYLEAQNIALLGTHLCNGSAVGVVVLTGSKTLMGRINKLTSAPANGRTNLQREITRFVWIIVALTVTLIVIMTITWAAWLRVDHFDFLNVPGFLTDVMGLVVAFIPEGLPIAVAMTLGNIARRMKNVNILPKSLSTVETLGCVNIVCSDKTGTLTENRMTVVSIGFADQAFTTESFSNLRTVPAYGQLETAMAVCNDAQFDDDTVAVEERKIQGNATDGACLRFAHAVDRNAVPKIFNLPFNSRNKYMLTVARPEKDLLLMIKGAPDVLIPLCTQIMNSDGSIHPLEGKARADLIAQQETWARQGQRVIMVAQKPFETDIEAGTTQYERSVTDSANDFTILGLIGIVDPPRADTARTVADCRRCGARFFMITGDFGLTAGAIAKQIGILTHIPDTFDKLSADGSDRSLVVEGKDLNAVTVEQWDQICMYEEVVFARTTPEHKLKIVEELRFRNFVVAVTGDGVNDAPALKAADVGIAMASGSEVAMEAADLILLGDFSSIIEGIRLGRLVFQNLQKVISYLLPAGSWSEDWPVFLNVFFGCPLPLSSFLMIIICCFTDLMCCLTLVFEEEEFDLLSLPPRNPKKSHLVNFKIYGQSYLFIGMLETITAHAMFFYYIYSYAGIPVHKMFFAFAHYSDGYYGHTQAELNNFLNTGQCVYFVTLVILQFANLHSVRNKRLSILQRGPFRNPWLFVGPVVSLAIAIFVTEEPGLQRLFGTASVPIKFWCLPIPLAVGILVMDEMRKLLVRSFPQGPLAKIAW